MNIEDYRLFIKNKSNSEIIIIKNELKAEIKDLKQQVKKWGKLNLINKYKYLKKFFSKRLEFINPDVINKLKKKQECLKIVNDILLTCK